MNALYSKPCPINFRSHKCGENGVSIGRFIERVANTVPELADMAGSLADHPLRDEWLAEMDLPSTEPEGNSGL